jgi:flagellar protein FliO/FliZ
MVGRLLLALCFVLGLMWMVGRWAKTHGRGGKGTDVMTVLARQQLSRNSSVAVVKVLDRAIILGVTDGRVSMLGDTDLAELEQRLAPQARAPRLRSAGPALPLTTIGEFGTSELGTGGAVGDQASARSGRAGRSGRSAAALSGSALSPATWRQAVELLRERTVRK